MEENNANWIKINRKILEWQWATDVSVFRLWIHLLLKANYKTGYFQDIVVERGQLVTGRKALSAETGLSENQVRVALDKLKSSGEITIKTTKKFSLITIVKYDFFQSEIDEPTKKNVLTSPQEKELKKYILNKKEKNIIKKEKSERDYSDEFNQLWLYYLKNSYDSPVGTKKVAWKQYSDLINSNSHDRIMAHVKGYLAECNKKKCKTKHLSTFLNTTDFRDEPEVVYGSVNSNCIPNIPKAEPRQYGIAQTHEEYLRQTGRLK